MITTFIVGAYLISVSVVAFLAMIFFYNAVKLNIVVKYILRISILIAIIIGFGKSCMCLNEYNMDKSNYNDGICSICGSQYAFTGGSQYKTTTIYYYTCDSCGHTIETHTIMK